MKKAIFTISEKHERITIRYKHKQNNLVAICEECGKQFDWLTINEAAQLTGKTSEDIRQNLEVLRRKNIEDETQ